MVGGKIEKKGGQTASAYFFLLCKDPHTRQIHLIHSLDLRFTHANKLFAIVYTRQQSLLLHSIFIMQISSHETDSFHSTTYFLHVSIIIQRSPQETDSTIYVHASAVILIAQYFYYAKILARNRFMIYSTSYFLHASISNRYAKILLTQDRFHQLCTCVSHYYCTSPNETDSFHQLFLHASMVIVKQYFCYAKILAQRQIQPVVVYMSQLRKLSISFYCDFDGGS